MRDGMAKVLVVLRWVQCGEWAPSRQGAAAWSSTVGNAILGSLIWWEGGLGGGGGVRPLATQTALWFRGSVALRNAPALRGARGAAKWRREQNGGGLRDAAPREAEGPRALPAPPPGGALAARLLTCPPPLCAPPAPSPRDVCAAPPRAGAGRARRSVSGPRGRAAGSMGKAAALCSGSTRGLVSLLSAVPCLACHELPGPGRRAMSAETAGAGGRGGGGAAAGGAPAAPGSDTYKGWLFKWTNYLKGYQRRWFVLSNGLLSYYRYRRRGCLSPRGWGGLRWGRGPLGAVPGAPRSAFRCVGGGSGAAVGVP